MSRAALGWPLLLLVICIGFFWKLTLTNQYTWLDSPEAAQQVLPSYQFQAYEWHHRRFPLWDPNQWGGQPLLAQAYAGAGYPPNWILFLTRLHQGWISQKALHWYYVLIHFQAGLFCYWLCVDLKRSRGASLLSGLAFALGGFVGTNNSPSMLNAAVWAPPVLLFSLRAMRGARPVSSAAWSGAFLGIAFLSGDHQAPVFLALAMAGIWIAYAAMNLRNWKLLLVFGAFAAIVAAFQVLPAYEAGSWNATATYPAQQASALLPESILGIVIPGVFRNFDPFIGLVALTLALLGLAGNWHDRTARILGAIAAGGLLFSMASVFQGVLYALLPMVERLPNVSMAVFIFHFGLCVLIAYGIDSYKSVKTGLAIWVPCCFAVVVGVATLVLLLVKKPGDDRLGMVVLIGFALSALLAAWRSDRISHRAAVVTLTLLMLLELGNVTTYGLKTQVDAKTQVKQLAEHADIARFLAAQPQPVRVDIDENDIPYNFGDWYGIDQFGGKPAPITANVARVQMNPRARSMYGIGFHIGRKPERPDQVEVFTADSGIKIYRNAGAFPRAWTVHEASSIENDDQIVPFLDQPDFDRMRQTFVKGVAPALQKCQGPETVTLQERQAGRLLFEADLKCGGMVVDADTFSPGWVATVDGKPSRIYEAYGFLRGVVVEDAGLHRIELRYRPKAVYWGAALTLIGLLGAVALSARVE